jgi:hypothetical protein
VLEIWDLNEFIFEKKFIKPNRVLQITLGTPRPMVIFFKEYK